MIGIGKVIGLDYETHVFIQIERIRMMRWPSKSYSTKYIQV